MRYKKAPRLARTHISTEYFNGSCDAIVSGGEVTQLVLERLGNAIYRNVMPGVPRRHVFVEHSLLMCLAQAEHKCCQFRIIWRSELRRSKLR